MAEYRKYENLHQLADKIDYEGGFYEAMRYGIFADEVPVEIEAEWRVAQRIFHALESFVEDFIDTKLPEPGTGNDDDY